MLPFFVWSLVVNPFIFVHSFEEIKSNMYSAISSIVNNTGLWFLPCLFILLVIFTFWMMINNRAKHKRPIIETGMVLIMFFFRGISIRINRLFPFCNKLHYSFFCRCNDGKVFYIL